MNVYKIELLIIDNDEVGENEIINLLEDTRYPNRCISPEVKSIEIEDIGEWYDDHPLNKQDQCDAEYERLFADINPWDCVLNKSIHGEFKRCLAVGNYPEGPWSIIGIVDKGDHREIKDLAMGYNCDYSRNGETKIYKNGKWEKS